MAAPALCTSACLERVFLAEQFRILLDRYNLKFVWCMDRLGLEEATRLTLLDFSECVEARKAVQAHAEEHGCMHFPEPQHDYVSPATPARSAAVFPRVL